MNNATNQQGSSHGLWRETASSPPHCPPLNEHTEADVVVVGGGYTGLSAALHLAEQGKSVHVLEAMQPGWGASGRNGGQVNPGWKIDPEQIRDRCGTGALGVVSAACDLVFELVDRFGIDCEAIRPGYVQGGFGNRGQRQLRERVRQWEQLGAPATYLDKRETAELLGTEVYDGAMLHGSGGNLQPLSYARGLARAAISLGALVHGDSPVRELTATGGGWRARTREGSVSAAQAIIACNGYTDNLWPGLGKTVVPVASVIAATEPLPPTLKETVLPGGHAVSETRNLQVYYRKDAAGRFVVGGRGPTWGSPEHGSDRFLRATGLRYFPQLDGVRWRYRWGGYVAMTTDHLPRLTRLAPGVLAGMGYNGRGIAMATSMGRQLAAELLGIGAGLPVTALRKVPLHAARKFGIAWMIAKGRIQDHLTAG